MVSEVKLSLIITTYNRAKYLCELLDVIANEPLNEFKNLEIIIADNNSSDNTFAIGQAFAARFPTWIYIRRPENIGFSKNLREALSVAHGEYIWAICDDDLIYPGTVAKVLRVLGTFRRCAVFLLNRDRYDITMARMIEKNCLRADVVDVMSGREIISRYGDALLNTSSVIINRRIAIAAAQRPEYLGTWCETLVLACTAVGHGGGVVIGNVSIKYREGNSGAWNFNWPAIYTYYIPDVVRKCSICDSSPDVFLAFMRTRKPYFFRGCLYLASSPAYQKQRKDIQGTLLHMYNYSRLYRWSCAAIFMCPRVLSSSMYKMQWAIRGVKEKARAWINRLFPLGDRERGQSERG